MKRFGFPPPPLWGRAGVGGSSASDISSGSPPSPTLPHKGGGRVVAVIVMITLAAAVPAMAQQLAPTDRIVATPFDGTWVGTAPASGSCAALTIRLSIEGGAVDGTASEPDAPRATVTG